MTTDKLIPQRDNLHLFGQNIIKKARRIVSPDIICLTAPNGDKLLLKDFRQCPLLIRCTWGRLVASREAAAYRKLNGIKGVPKFITQLDPYAFVVEFMDAMPLPRMRNHERPPLEFFDSLSAAVNEMHARGVAHGDLRRHNILMNADGSPCLIDFETSISRKRWFPQAGLFKAVSKIDNITILKIKSRYYPEAVSEQDRKILADVPWHLKLGRLLRHKIYHPMTEKGMRQRKRRDERRQARRNATRQ